MLVAAAAAAACSAAAAAAAAASACLANLAWTSPRVCDLGLTLPCLGMTSQVARCDLFFRTTNVTLGAVRRAVHAFSLHRS